MKRYGQWLVPSVITLAIGGWSAVAASHHVDTNNSASYLKSYSASQDQTERARGYDVGYFAGGCFWGTESEFKNVPGVVSTLVGYTGGRTKLPTYETVCRHDTGHAETVRVVFDPKKITYEQLVGKFLELHDPTTLNRQGPDVGDQYRSAIFFESEDQKQKAQKVLDSSAAKFGNRKIVTSLENFGTFYSAEDYHQNYFAKNGGASCHIH